MNADVSSYRDEEMTNEMPTRRARPATVVSGATIALLALTMVAMILSGCATGGVYGRDYEKILKSSPGYTEELPEEAITFTYQRPDTSELRRLRETFSLEKVAGSGSDQDRLIRLMEWVHDQVPHDGNSNPPAWNTFAILAHHDRTGEGVNCRKLAIALSEVYLAMGYPAKHVTCMPEQNEFTDCHVVTAVWAPDESRWLMMDPSFEAFVTNECGTILGISEFREALRTGRTVHLNKEANWNGSLYREERYLHYMTKNLYRYDAPVESEFNYEAPRRDREYLELVPEGHKRTGVYRSTVGDGSTRTHHVTSNPEVFWQPPEL